MSIFTVDVWWSCAAVDPQSGTLLRTAAWATGEEWSRVWVEAAEGTEAELTACHIVGTQGGREVVRSCVVDWP